MNPEKKKATSKTIIQKPENKHHSCQSNSRSKIFQKTCHHRQKKGYHRQVGARQNHLYCNRKRKRRLRGEVGWRWMPQKASRYPPIHDHIDATIDFSVAVWKGWQRRDGSRSQGEERAKTSEDELSERRLMTVESPQQRRRRVKHAPRQRLWKFECCNTENTTKHTMTDVRRQQWL